MIKTEAIILRKRSLPNQDLIVTFFTQDLGKINVIAKGVKKITSRRLPHTQTGNLVTILVNKKTDRFYLDGISLISAFSLIKENQAKIQLLYFFFFILERLLPENQREEEIYRLTKKYLIDLSKVSDPSSVDLTGYTNNLLKKLGYIKEDKPFDELKGVIQDLINEPLPSFS
ncbi:DNA repair protein RecO [Candidatus Roizmanbacteria bacterium]|nr:DNA repair protein RecO [Candidatus Roizmanbacteria bacterium]